MRTTVNSEQRNRKISCGFVWYAFEWNEKKSTKSKLLFKTLVYFHILCVAVFPTFFKFVSSLTFSYSCSKHLFWFHFIIIYELTLKPNQRNNFSVFMNGNEYSYWSYYRRMSNFWFWFYQVFFVVFFSCCRENKCESKNITECKDKKETNIFESGKQ